MTPNYAANHQVREQGDFNNMDVLAALGMQTRINNMIANAATGLMYAGPGLTDPPNKNGDGTVEEKKGQAGGGNGWVFGQSIDLTLATLQWCKHPLNGASIRLCHA